MRSSSKCFCALFVIPAGLLFLSSLFVVPAAAQVGSTAQAAGITFETLSSEDLDAIEQETGYRVGVYAAAVQPGSPGAAAGIKEKDIIIIIGETGVDNAQAAAAAVNALSGSVEVMAFTSTADGYAPTTYTLNLSGATPPTTGPPGPPSLGWQLQALDQEALDKIEKATGHRVGVLIVQVTPGSPADQAGLKANDILLVVGKTGVDSLQAVEQALAGQSGSVEILAMRPSKDKFEPVQCTVNLAASSGQYRDPQGRFELQPPPDWTMEAFPNGQGLSLTRGEANLTLMVFAGTGTSQELLESVAKQIRGQTKDYRELGRGETQVGGQTAPMIEFTGVNPKGMQAHSQITASVGTGAGYVFLLSAPENEFAAVRPVWEALLNSFRVSGAAVPVVGGPETPVAAGQGDPVTAYFDMMDFIRTQAWGRTVTTSNTERQRAAALLEQSRGEMDSQAQTAIEQLPQVWTNLKKTWASASEKKKAEQRDYWRKQLLVPTQLFIPPETTETFRGSSDRVVFDYPTGWIVAQTESEGTQYLYLGPPGTETSWDQVVNASTSPPGALFVVSPITEEMKSLDSYLEAARVIAQQFVTAGAPDFKEIDAMELGEDGAIITLLGRFPGEREEKFFWVGNVRYGPDYFFAGRLGGPSAQAETLIPAFGNMLTTIELNPPGGGGGGGGGDYGSAMVDYYAAKAGNIATSGPW